MFLGIRSMNASWCPINVCCYSGHEVGILSLVGSWSRIRAVFRDHRGGAKKCIRVGKGGELFDCFICYRAYFIIKVKIKLNVLC